MAMASNEQLDASLREDYDSDEWEYEYSSTETEVSFST